MGFTDTISAGRRRGHKLSSPPSPIFTTDEDSAAIKNKKMSVYHKSKSLVFLYSQTASCKSVLMIGLALMLLTFPLVQKKLQRNISIIFVTIKQLHRSLPLQLKLKKEKPHRWLQLQIQHMMYTATSKKCKSNLLLLLHAWKWNTPPSLLLGLWNPSYGHAAKTIGITKQSSILSPTKDHFLHLYMSTKLLDRRYVISSESMLWFARSHLPL